MGGAEGRTRTGTPITATGPKPVASTNFATPATQDAHSITSRTSYQTGRLNYLLEQQQPPSW